MIFLMIKMVVLELSLQLIIFLAFCLKPDFSKSENSTSIDVLTNFDITHKMANYDVQIGSTTNYQKSSENFSFFGFLENKKWSRFFIILPFKKKSKKISKKREKILKKWIKKFWERIVNKECEKAFHIARMHPGWKIGFASQSWKK